MKKNILLLIAFIGIIGTVSAQFTVWEDNFDDNDISDWTIYDTNEDGQSWQANQDLQVDNTGSAVLNGTHAVMAIYGLDFSTGLPLGGGNGYNFTKEWAISPAIDLSFYTGTTELTFNAQSAVYGGDRDLYVYASTSSDTINFQQVGLVTIIRNPPGTSDYQFQDYTVDISDYVGEDEVYFAFRTIDNNYATGYEIDGVSISVEDLAVDKIDQKETKLITNPIQDRLLLQLGTGLNAESTQVQLYDMTGKLIKKSQYQESGIVVNYLPAGLYMARISNGTTSTTLKFIKQ